MCTRQPSLRFSNKRDPEERGSRRTMINFGKNPGSRFLHAGISRGGVDRVLKEIVWK